MATQNTAISKEIIRNVAKASGWTQFKAKREIANAQKLGISPKQYLKKQCWAMGPDELKELGDRLEHQRKIREEEAAELSRLTGWSEQESARRIQEAKSAGLTFKQYVNRRGYEIPHEDLPHLAMVLKAVKRHRMDNQMYMIDMIVERSGWTRSYVEKKLEEAKEAGINIFNYFANSCWTMDAKQLQDCASHCKKLQENAQDKKEKCEQYVLEHTGWTEGEYILHTLETLADCGCLAEDFARCHMWDMPKEKQRTFLNSTIFRKFRIANNDFQIGSPIFDYKDNFEDVFSDLISRRHFAFSGMTKGEFIDAIRGLSSIVVKPVRGSYGRDIEVYPCNESYLQNGELYERLAKIDTPIIIEEKIEQCDVLNELCPTSVNTLRVVTLRREGQTHVLQCVLRCGVGAFVDNIHSGGLVIEVNPQTGICEGDAVDYFGNLVEKHPVTGVTFKGLRIPNMGDVLTLAEEASKVVPECKLIGWDIAVTQDGADLVEGNLKADYDAGQMAHLGVAREGLRNTMVAPYVNPSVLGHSYIDDILQENEDAERIDTASFKFSVVIPVYNAQNYLHETMKSIMGQTIGFKENVQVILVNDGSSDNSAEICKGFVEQYPDNVVYVDKENGGPSSARNAGIPYASGAFINFLDSDDKWSNDAFENVWKLIKKHKGEIDVIGCRQKFFEGKTGYHQLDYKFKESDQVVNINEHPDYVQLSATSAFIAASVFDKHTFDARISLGDDSKLLIEAVLDKSRYGLCRSAIHHFRKRDDDSSITQNKTTDKSAFIDTIEHYYEFIADYSEEKFGRIIPYVQHCLVNGLKYRVSKPIPEVLDEAEGKTYKDKIISLISRVYDGVLLDARNASPSLKLYMMHLKNDLPANVLAQVEGGGVWVNNGLAFKITGNGDVRLKDIQQQDDSLLVDGLARIPGFVDSYGLFCEAGKEIIEVSLTDGAPERKSGITGEKISTTVPFSILIPPSSSGFDIRMFASYNQDVICIPMSVESDSALAQVKKTDVKVGDYTISRPDRHTLSIKKA